MICNNMETSNKLKIYFTKHCANALSMSQEIDFLINFVESTKSSVNPSRFNLSNFNHIEILQFWFGTNAGTDWTQNQRTKWFVSSRDPLQQKLDEIIRNRFGSLLNGLRTDSKLLSEWKTHSASSCLAAIIVLDQFSRHIFRSEVEREVRGNRPNIDDCDALALSLSQYLFSLDKNAKVRNTGISIQR